MTPRGFQNRVALALAIILLFSSVCVPAVSTKRTSGDHFGGEAASERIQRRAFSDKRDDDKPNGSVRDEETDNPAGQQNGHTVMPGQGQPNGGEEWEQERPNGGNGQSQEPPSGGGESGGGNDPSQEPPAGGGENGVGDDPGQEPPAGGDENGVGDDPGQEPPVGGGENGEGDDPGQEPAVEESGDGDEELIEGTGTQTEAAPDGPTEDRILEEGNLWADRETARDWELLFVNMEFTGDWNQDFLNVVFSQLGYTASWDNYIVTELNGRQRYTRYGAWFGFPYGAWCAMFVSFCLNYAGVPKDAMMQSASVARMVEWLRARDRFKFNWDDYAPQPGDLVFFSQTRRRTPTHVGVVTGVMNNTLLTVEGNNGPTVASFMYDINDPIIVGYGVFPDQSEYYREESNAAEPESEPVTGGGMSSPEPVLEEEELLVFGISSRGRR